MLFSFRLTALCSALWLYHKHEHCLPCLARARLLFGIYLPVRRISWYFWYLIWETTRLQCRRPRFDSWVRKIPWKRDRLPTPVFLRFPGGSDSKESACDADISLRPGFDTWVGKLPWRWAWPPTSVYLCWVYCWPEQGKFSQHTGVRFCGISYQSVRGKVKENCKLACKWVQAQGNIPWEYHVPSQGKGVTYKA